jgi:hypothetical protein
MFALAIASVERAAVALVGPGSKPVQQFRAQVPSAVHVRDMATHFDAYLRGTGKLELDGTVTGSTT